MRTDFDTLQLSRLTKRAANETDVMAEFESGERELSFIQKRGRTMAVIMSPQKFEEIITELKILRAASAGMPRAASYKEAGSVSLADVQQGLDFPTGRRGA